MREIEHQLKNNSIPKWDVKHLFIGTFNPQSGQQVNYYYGREKNQLWKILSRIFDENFDTKDQSFFKLLIKHKIACIDMINKVFSPDDRIEKIIGKGYNDNEIINSFVTREYNTETILNIINKNKGITVYTTFGKGSSLKEWKKEIEKLGEVRQLVSPSLAARVPKGKKKFDFMLSDWKNKIIVE